MDLSQDGEKDWWWGDDTGHKSALCEVVRKTTAVIWATTLADTEPFPAVNHAAYGPAYLRVRRFVIRHLGVIEIPWVL